MTMSEQSITTIYTIGHSTHPIEEFLEILQSFKVNQLVDIRTIARSRHNPQFEQDALQESLSSAQIKYVYAKNLGGLRSAKKDAPSENSAWRNASFRNYADYMQSTQFADAVEQLVEIAMKHTTAIMCAEAVPWRCHRSLVGDALLVRNVEVIDIFDATHSKPHTLTSFAKHRGTKLTYPPE